MTCKRWPDCHCDSVRTCEDMPREERVLVLLRDARDALTGLYSYCPDGFAYMPADKSISDITEFLK